MIENLFGRAFTLENDRNTQIRFGFPEEMKPDLTVTGPNVEQIDMGESVLVIIEDRTLRHKPEVSILGTELIVGDGSGRKAVRVSLDSAINAEESIASFRNGILEITLVKSTDQKTDSDSEEYKLRVI